MSCGIYKIQNKINNKVYIGQSINIETRWRHHKSYPLSSSHYPIYRAFNKYGLENFDFSIIELCSVNELNEKEIYYIKKYNSYYKGYNQTTGGSGNSNFSLKLSNEDVEIIYDLLLNTTIPQKDIALQFSVGEDTISEINNGKTRINNNLNYPLRKKIKRKKFCLKCGKEILSSSTYCSNCIKIISRIVERPNREELKQLIRTTSFVQIGKKFNVTDNTIRKWCKSENLPSKVSEIKKYSDIEWKNI